MARDQSITLSELGFRASYKAAFHDHVLGAREDTLRAAYELGREAVTSGLSLLHVAHLHQEVLLSEIRLGGMDPEHVVLAAGDFFLESLSAFEMVRRGFEETHEAAVLERSRVEMLQQLSDFLADTSLASDSTEPLEEVLRLVAEQGREVTGAGLCVVSLTGYGWELQASSYVADDADAAGELEAVRPSAVASLTSEERLAAALTSLSGEKIGAIELFGDQQASFTTVDKAALLHLSQMASAAIERVHLHSTRPVRD